MIPYGVHLCVLTWDIVVSAVAAIEAVAVAVVIKEERNRSKRSWLTRTPGLNNR